MGNITYYDGTKKLVGQKVNGDFGGMNPLEMTVFFLEIQDWQNKIVYLGIYVSIFV